MGFLLTALGFGTLALIAALSQQGAPAAGPAARATTPPDPELLRQFLASNPTAEQIEAVARQLDAAGYPETAQTLRAVAQQSAERPAVPGEPLPPPPPPGTPQPESTAAPLPLRPGDDARPTAAPTSPDGLTEAERAQLATLPPDVAAELAAYVSSRPVDAPTRGAVLAAAASVARGGSVLSPSQREQSAALLGGYGLTQTAAWLRSVPAATTPQAPSSAPPGATPPQASTTAPPTLQNPPGRAVRTAAYSETGARQLAPRVASDIKMRARNYNREALAEFQRAAGIYADGVYGGETRGALVFYGVRDAPGALFRPTSTVRYTPPPAA